MPRFEWGFAGRLAGLMVGLLIVWQGLAVNAATVGAWQESTVESQEGDEAEEEEQELPPFDYGDMVVQPSQLRDDAPPLQYVKPGHWITANKPIISYEADFLGILESDCVSAQGVPLATENTRFHLISRRPVPLARAQWRDNEVNLYVPRRTGPAKGVTLRHRLLPRGGGRPVINEAQPVSALDDYQYLFVVLTDDPADYAFLRVSNALGHDELAESFGSEKLRYYELLTPRIENRVPLPSQALAWTAMAYVVWDQPGVDKFNPDQQAALVDWLHFGGQLIVSGPESLDALRGTFLEPYLPALSTRPTQLGPDSFRELNANWSVPKQEAPAELRELRVDPQQPLVGVELGLQPGGEFMAGTGKLIAERFLGRGRIVVSAFSLSDRQLLRWQSWEGFWNGCLMRRPARRFDLDSLQGAKYRYANFAGAKRDPLLSTTLRFLSRDVSTLGRTAKAAAKSDAAAGTDESDMLREPGGISRLDTESLAMGKQYGWFFGGYASTADSGVAGWNDQSGMSRAARGVLRESAGITPPTSQFVLQVLLVYLAVVVPVNWIVFRLIGRIEWAWASIPVIAIISAIVVVRLAALDIGFVRSRTEVALLELHAGHSRGHLTRYTAVYSSLSTGYDFNFDDISSQSQPFATSSGVPDDSDQTLRDVIFERDREVRLTDLQVDSSSVRMVHSEQMYQLGQGLSWMPEAGGGRLSNETSLTIRDVGLLYRDEDGRVFRDWLGDLPAQQTGRRVRWEPLVSSRLWLDEWSEVSELTSHRAFARGLLQRLDTNGDRKLVGQELQNEPELLELARSIDRREGLARSLRDRTGRRDGALDFNELKMLSRLSRNDELNLGELMEVATENLEMLPGEVRLFGWTDQGLGQLEIKPTSSQSIQRTLVVAHLQRAVIPQPERDTNSWHDFINSQNYLPGEDFTQESTESPEGSQDDTSPDKSSQDEASEDDASEDDASSGNASKEDPAKPKASGNGSP